MKCAPWTIISDKYSVDIVKNCNPINKIVPKILSDIKIVFPIRLWLIKYQHQSYQIKAYDSKTNE